MITTTHWTAAPIPAPTVPLVNGVDPHAQPPPEPFPLFHASSIVEAVDVPAIVSGLLTAGGASVLYGSSNTGKTFFALDIEAAVASGRPFRGDMEVEQGAVIHLALEGETGVRNRVLAMRKAGKLPDAAELYVMSSPCSLLSMEDAARLVATVKAAAELAKQPVRLVVIDTLSRAIAGGDENSSRDMTSAVRAIDAIRAETGAHCLIVHHCGKDEAKGARGHSSLRAAVDTEIEVARDEASGISTAFIAKQRDMAKGEPMPYSLDVVEIGRDRRSEAITSCVVRHEAAIMAIQRGGKTGREAVYRPVQLLDFLPADSVKNWQERTSEETGMSRAAFYSFKNELPVGSYQRKTDGTLDKP